jgi:hypothetical protein
LACFAAKSEYVGEGSDPIGEGKEVETALIGRSEGGETKGTEAGPKAGEETEKETRAGTGVILTEAVAEAGNERCLRTRFSA